MTGPSQDEWDALATLGVMVGAIIGAIAIALLCVWALCAWVIGPCTAPPPPAESYVPFNTNPPEVPVPKAVKPKPYQYRVLTVERVHDGDTATVMVDLGFDIVYRANVRVGGVNTPERSGATIKAGTVARDATSDWLNLQAGRKDLFLESTEWDKYGGRCLGNFLTGEGKQLSTYLIEAGLAHPYKGDKKAPFTTAELARIEAWVPPAASTK